MDILGYLTPANDTLAFSLLLSNYQILSTSNLLMSLTFAICYKHLETYITKKTLLHLND